MALQNMKSIWWMASEENATLMDRAKKLYHHKLIEGTSSTTLVEENKERQPSKDPLTKGWALKNARTSKRFNERFNVLVYFCANVHNEHCDTFRYDTVEGENGHSLLWCAAHKGSTSSGIKPVQVIMSLLFTLFCQTLCFTNRATILFLIPINGKTVVDW